MREGKRSSLLFALCLIVGISVLLISANPSWSQTPPTQVSLTTADCVKCHAGPPADIAAAGGGHNKITCTDCHAGHRPAVKDNIPKCSQCHMGKPHYELKDCLTCHRNPHTPLKVAFASNLTDPCLTCHTQQIKQLKDNKSKHTLLYCTTCHNVHRKVPECLQCHKPHSSDMVKTDCKNCHKPHMPKAVTYASDIPSKNCGACHRKAFDLLSASSAKHKNFACAFCHQEKHKMIPKCQDCHGLKHPAGIMAKFPKCGECHNIAHDLNHWPVTEKKEAAKEIKKKK